MGLLFQQQKQKKEVAIGQALAPCICRLLCGHGACLSRTLYGDFIIADFFCGARPKKHQHERWTKTAGGDKIDLLRGDKMFGAKNLMIDIGGGKIPAIKFGKGTKNLIILPGLGDGLTTVRGKAIPMAIMYREFMKDFTVYMMSRREPLPEDFSTKDMAEDIAIFMEHMGIEKASIIGVSMGGMIAQHFAAEFPERTEKLVLVVTAPKTNDTITENVKTWAEMARQGKGAELMESNVKNMYSDEYYRKNRWLTPVMGKIAVPKNPERFLSMAKACAEHDAEAVLEKIKAPVLVIGGTKDRTVGAAASYELAEKIPGARLFMYEGYRHALYEEAPDFNQRVLDFLNE